MQRKWRGQVNKAKGESSTFKEPLFPALGLAPAGLPACHASIFSERVFQSGVWPGVKARHWQTRQ